MKIATVQQPPANPITIITSPCGRFKLAIGSTRGAALATWIRHHRPLLRDEIQHARAVWIATKEVTGADPSFESIRQQFPQIAALCTDKNILDYVANNGTRTALGAAQDVMEGLFRNHSPKSIDRMGRDRRK